MKHIKYKLIALMAIIAFSSCEPRIELDKSEWGNHSELINVVIFQYEFDEHELQEFQETGELTPSVRKVVRSSGQSIAVDLDVEGDPTNTGSASVNIPSVAADDVYVMAVVHDGTLVEPLNDAPVLGLPADLTNGPYTYRIHSADGNYTDWTITINQL